MRPIDPKIIAILEKYGENPKEAMWDCHGTWVIYHRVLERIAARAKITFDPPIPLEANGANKSVAICVSGGNGTAKEWSIGEAAPGNNKNGYPYAMAEKRAKDRVILKLIGLHGTVYSEDEMDNDDADSALLASILMWAVRLACDETDLNEWASDDTTKVALRRLSPEDFKRVKQAKDNRLAALKEAAR